MSPRASSRLRYRQYLVGRAADGDPGRLPGRRRPSHRPTAALLRAFLAELRGLQRPIVLSLLAATVAIALRLVFPAATGLALDHVLGHRRLPPMLTGVPLPASSRALLTLIAVVLIAVAASSTTAATWGRYVHAMTQRSLQSRLRRRVFKRAIALPLHRIRSYQSGGLAGVLREDVGAAANLLSTLVYQPWRSVVQLVGTFVALAVVDWRMLAGVVFLLPGLYVVHRRWIRRIRPLWRDIRLLRRRSDARVTETFVGVRVIRSFGRQRTEIARYGRDQHLILRQEMLTWKIGAVIDVAWSLLVPVAVACLIWYGGSRILDDAERVAAGTLAPADAFTTGALVTFLFYLAMLLEPLGVLANTASSAQSGLAGLDRVLDLLEEAPEFAGATGTLVLRPQDVAGRVTVRNVTFRYPNQRQAALRGVSLDVAAGQVVALVGPSGAGKSTLCDVIARFHDPNEGVVELDGVDVRKIDLASYRRLFGLVEQDVFLFEGTIAENIGYGVRDADPARIRWAAEAALAAEFIERLEEGYDTRVGERGVRLSGGQRKRLAIARALLTDPRILILDEATSELDAESERLIHLSLASLMRGRTVFVIAHRLSTVAHADLIVVLDAGRVVAEGRHADLLERSAVYRRLVDAQLLDLERPLGPDPAGR